MYMISRCCVGMRCRYRHNGYLRQIAVRMGEGEDFVAVCPEQDGGLPTPREGCSVIGGRVVGRRTGTDYTAQYRAGAQRALDVALALGINRAYLLHGSPSCGLGYGITAALLQAHGIEVIAI